MASKTLTVRDFAQYLAKLRKNLKGHDGAVVRGIHAGVLRGIGILHAATVNAPPASPNGSTGAVDTGAYRQAWQHQLLPTGGRLFNTRPYAGVIERGRRRGAKMPPPRVLEAWARRKLGLSDEEAKSASFAIARAIKRRGLLPRRVLTGPLTTAQLTRAVMEEIRREVLAALRRAKGGL